mmetsp:Transcript_20251/g.34822  ORF Transcript_20251/g.34822 Transcript_20251/m.34822 type:complete len:219 (-) Transcript_20251:1070-1726(-)
MQVQSTLLSFPKPLGVGRYGTAAESIAPETAIGTGIHGTCVTSGTCCLVQAAVCRCRFNVPCPCQLWAGGAAQRTAYCSESSKQPQSRGHWQVGQLRGCCTQQLEGRRTEGNHRLGHPEARCKGAGHKPVACRTLHCSPAREVRHTAVGILAGHKHQQQEARRQPHPAASGWLAAGRLQEKPMQGCWPRRAAGAEQVQGYWQERPDQPVPHEGQLPSR